ncbi:MAG TPA: Fur family transcriptional regulator [Armatimonadota bacterium]|nr:Fur family transcriptional regulator [Armatimonadota bacterium]
MLTAESAQSALQRAGVRLTPQRLMIVDVLVGNRTHPTIEQIYATARQRYPTLSLATVYHTVDLLAKHGLILELRGSKDGLRCDPDTAPHAHAYCTECNAVYDIILPAAAAPDASALDGFRATRVDISLYGECQACRT